MNYEVYGTTESADQNPKRNWEWLGEVKTFEKAKETAIRVSLMKMWHEVELRLVKKGDIEHHSYWQNGKLKIQMI